MKPVMKLLLFVMVSLAATLGFALSLRAQESMTPNYGLIGSEYSSLAFGYTHHIDGPPRVLHSYGFVSSKPTLPNLDAAFKYTYTTGSAANLASRLHEVSVGATQYWSLNAVKPFLQGEAGWAMQKTGTARDNSYTYLAGIGAEFQMTPQLVLIPTVNYSAAPQLHNHRWSYAGDVTYRLFKEWSASFAVSLDQRHNLKYGCGVNHHF